MEVQKDLTVKGVVTAGSGAVAITDAAGKVLPAAVKPGVALQVLRTNQAGNGVEFGPASPGSLLAVYQFCT